jgi:hypothetical protein
LWIVEAQAHGAADEEAEDDSRPSRDEDDFLHAIAFLEGNKLKRKLGSPFSNCF